MNPLDLVTPSLVNKCRSFSTIVIIGYTKTGKHPIAKKLASDLNYPLFVSDNYINASNRQQSLYDMMDHILPYYNQQIPFIVEGVLCFRLLRKGIQLNNFIPDLIIKTKCNDKTIEHFYKKDKEEHKIKRALSFNKGLNTIWDEYLNLLRNNSFLKKPNFIELNTSL